VRFAVHAQVALRHERLCPLADAPTLKRGDEAIQARGASLRYLPQYSPDFNPIELVFHPLKTVLRKAAERTIEGLARAARSFIRALDPAECRGYFRACRR
jgi:transposase